MAVNTTPGNIIGIRIGGIWLDCQVDATFNGTANVTEDDPCKPSPDDLNVGETPWIERTIDTRDWSIDFSTKLMKDSLAASNPDMVELFIDGALDVEVEFMTRPGQTVNNYDLIIAGSGILTSVTLNAPVTGAATTDATISGNGPLSYTKVPVTT